MFELVACCCCVRNVGTDDVDDACRMVTGLPSLERAAAAAVPIMAAGFKAVCVCVAVGSAVSERPLMDRNPSPFDAMTARLLVDVVVSESES